MNSTPFFWAASASDFLMGREASETSDSLLPNFLNPPPVPDVPTGTRTFGFAFWNSSATASEMGKTVLDPSIWMVPDRFPPEASTPGPPVLFPLLQPAMAASVRVILIAEMNDLRPAGM